MALSPGRRAAITVLVTAAFGGALYFALRGQQQEQSAQIEQQEVAALGRIAACLDRIAAALEKPEPEEVDDDSALVAALSNLRLPAPIVNVAAPMAAESPARGWRLQITARDGAGNIRDISIKPE